MPPRRARRRGMIAGAAIANSRSRQAAQPAAAPQQAAPSAAPDMTKQLTDLKGLLDNGILTQEEFDAKKKQILGL
jgi:membrane protease subunit (stomatin/prohibitin family)